MTMGLINGNDLEKIMKKCENCFTKINYKELSFIKPKPKSKPLSNNTHRQKI